MSLLLLDAFLSASDGHVMPYRVAADMHHIVCCRTDFRELKYCEGGGRRGELTTINIGIETSSLVKIGPKYQEPYYINPLTPNGRYRDRTAPLTSKVVFYIFIQQI